MVCNHTHAPRKIISTTLARGHGPRHPAMVRWTRLRIDLAFHSDFHVSNGTGGNPFSVFPQQQASQTRMCPS